MALAVILRPMAPNPTPFPQTLPIDTVVGRLGVGSGPAQAIPFSVLALYLSLTPSVVQVVTADATIALTTDFLIINRVAPTSTLLTLPNAALRNGRPLAVVDFSTSVTDHSILLTPFSAGQEIMRSATWPMYSNPASLASLTLIPIADPDHATTNYVWIIAP